MQFILEAQLLVNFFTTPKGSRTKKCRILDKAHLLVFKGDCVYIVL